MYYLFLLNTEIHINTILKYSCQCGGNILFYRYFIEKRQDDYYKKNNYYLIFTNINTIDIINKFFYNKVFIDKFNIKKLNFLNNLNYINFKIYNYSLSENKLVLLKNKNYENIFSKINLYDYINSTISKICTKYIPVDIKYDIIKDHINLSIYFEKNIKLRYKYIIYTLLKNMIICFNGIDSLEDNISWIIL